MIARCVALALAVFVAGCGSPVASGPLDPDPVAPGPVSLISPTLTGTWDATYFKDSVKRDGTPSTGIFYGYALELRQEGDVLSGTLIYVGDDAFSMPISGAVVKSGVTYSGELTYSSAGVPFCRITATAELIVDAHSTRLSGPMSYTCTMLDPRAVDCQGTVTGTLTAIKE